MREWGLGGSLGQKRTFDIADTVAAGERVGARWKFRPKETSTPPTPSQQVTEWGLGGSLRQKRTLDTAETVAAGDKEKGVTIWFILVAVNKDAAS